MSNPSPEAQAAFDAAYEQLVVDGKRTADVQRLDAVAQRAAGAMWDDWKFDMLASAARRIPNAKQRGLR